MRQLRRVADFRQRRIPEGDSQKLRAGLSSGPSGDEVYTPSPRRSEGQCGQLGGTLFAPHCEQNLYANPKRTAKSKFVSKYQIHHPPHLFKNLFGPIHMKGHKQWRQKRLRRKKVLGVFIPVPESGKWELLSALNGWEYP
jgi:hypothetical protein